MRKYAVVMLLAAASMVASADAYKWNGSAVVDFKLRPSGVTIMFN